MTRALAAILAIALSCSAAMAWEAVPLRISEDPGGRVVDYRSFVNDVRFRRPVEVVGKCMSACTMFLMLPHDQLCFGPKAILGFHQAEIDGKPDAFVTMLILQEYYPKNIQAWVDTKGGVARMPTGANYWSLTGPELWRIGYRKC